MIPLIASVLFGLVVLAAGSRPRQPSILSPFSIAPVSVRTTSQPVSTDPAFVPTFRLGSAAQPFGWSTAVGDFNTDGTPDLVIADHTSRRAGLYAYQIQFTLVPLRSLWLLGRGVTEGDNLLVRVCKRLYRPVFRLAIERRVVVVLVAVSLLAGSLALVPRLGTEF